MAIKSEPSLNYFAASSKKFNELVVFVPFFGGTIKSLRRHIEFVNRLGYDAVFVELRFKYYTKTEIPLSSEMRWGMKHVWAEQIEKVLNSFAQRKIVYAFSNPSASAIEAVARRKAADICALICDGGPTGEPFKSIHNYFVHEDPIVNPLPRWTMAAFGTLSWVPRFWGVAQEDLNSLPNDFSILSIRGWKDPLISPRQIDLVFDRHSRLKIQKLNLPEGAHLNGLRDFSEVYEPEVELFLKRHSSTK